MKQLELPTDQPTSVECSGADLLTVLADLKTRGAKVMALHVIGIARYRLSLSWH